MTDAPYEGFLFEHSRSDLNAPNGARKVKIIAVAQSLEEARALAGNILPEQGLQLIEHGLSVLKSAKLAGVANGEAQTL